MKSDLRTISELNDIFKYADDTTLLVPEHTDVDLNIEFNHIKQWATTNGLIINSNKTKEVVFRQPRVSCFYLPAAIDDSEQVDCCKLLGVMFQNNCKMDSHVQYILSQCAQRIYLLKLLQRQGMPRNLLAVVTYSIVISRVFVCLAYMGRVLIS